MQLEKIFGIEKISKRDFENTFLKPGVPVIIKDFVAGSPALSQWSYDYFKQRAGHLQVSVHGGERAHDDKAKSLPVTKMPFGEYLDRIDAEPTELRLFLFNLLRINPDMRHHLQFRIKVKNFLPSLPFMFFGGEGSGVRNHYDIDMGNVFLTQFKGIKKVVLFPHDQSALLYKLPFNFHGIADTYNPDYNKYPGLRYVRGFECLLYPGETLFIPSGYWHHIRYVTAGYSVSHRALPVSVIGKLKGVSNIFITQKIDNAMRRLLNERWYDYKVKKAVNRANKAINTLEKVYNTWAGDIFLAEAGKLERMFDV